MKELMAKGVQHFCNPPIYQLHLRLTKTLHIWNSFWQLEATFCELNFLE